MKPLHPLRLKDPFEKAFRKEWQILQSGKKPFDILAGPTQEGMPEPYVNFDICQLTGGVVPYTFGRMTERDHLIAIEFAQWLGTPCGIAFIERALNKCKAGIRFNYE